MILVLEYYVHIMNGEAGLQQTPRLNWWTVPHPPHQFHLNLPNPGNPNYPSNLFCTTFNTIPGFIYNCRAQFTNMNSQTSNNRIRKSKGSRRLFASLSCFRLVCVLEIAIDLSNLKSNSSSAVGEAHLV